MQQRVVDLLGEAPLTQGELAERLGLSQQGLNHHVKSLERAGHIKAVYDGRVWRYRPADPAESVPV
jgi:DNA-binding MarR family transcriptional regulator